MNRDETVFQTFSTLDRFFFSSFILWVEPVASKPVVEVEVCP